jgi:CHASE3 domain sensor protein
VSLRRRLAAIALVYLVLIAAGASSAVVLGERRAAASGDAAELRVGLERTLRLGGSYAAQQLAERSYVFSGDEQFLETYATASREADALLVALADLADEHDGLAAPLAAVVEAGVRWRTEGAEPAITARGTSREAAEAVVADGTITDRVAELTVALNDLEQAASRMVDDADDDESAAGRVLFAVLGSTVVVGIAVAGGAAFAIERWVTRPVDRLVTAVRSTRAGELEPVPTDGPRELAEIGSAIDDMRAMVIGQRDLAIRARETIEQTAAVLLHLRSELAGELGDFPAGWTAAAGLVPAEGIVAGDCYDVQLISPHLLAVVVLDISGHGAGPAITALRSKELARAALRSRMEPGQAFGWIQRQLGDLGDEFLTAFLAVIDTVSGRLRYASAGHPPALLVHDQRVAELGPTGPLLAWFPAEWRTVEAVLDPGGRLVAYTDGLIEARAGDRSFYGQERLADVVAGASSGSADALLAATLGDLRTFRPGRVADDVTIVVVGHEPSASDELTDRPETDRTETQRPDTARPDTERPEPIERPPIERPEPIERPPIERPESIDAVDGISDRG